MTRPGDRVAMRGHEAVARALADHGVRDVFGVLGDGNLLIIDSFVAGGGTYYSFSNEVGGVLAALGYARATGRLGLATVTHGPGLTNIATALVEARKGRLPVLVLAGDTGADDHNHLQAFPQRPFATASGAEFVPIRAARTVASDVARAVRIALLERRPVVLDVTTDILDDEVDYQRVHAGVVGRPDLTPTDDALDAAAGLLASAERPVLLAGRGACQPDARQSLVELAERTGAPLTTTLMAKDLFRGHPADRGIFGTLSTATTLDVIGRSDCVVAFGASLNHWTTVDGSLLRGKRVVHVDHDPRAHNAYLDSTASVVGGAAATARSFVRLLDEAGVPGTGYAASHPPPGSATRAGGSTHPDGTVEHQAALRLLDETFPRNRTLVVDAGRHARFAMATIHVPEPTAYVHTVSFGAIGLGLAAAIGAAVGTPHRRCLLVTGDGGFMLGGLAEFNTAVRHDIDLVTVVFNDGAYGAEHVQFRNRGRDPALSMFDWPDFAKVAEALGGRGYTARSLTELERSLAQASTAKTPALINVFVDPDKMTRPVA